MSDDFESIVAGFELDTSEPTVDYSSLTTAELRMLYRSVTEDLIGRREMMHPHTDEGRDLHSQRAAILITLRSRGLLL